MRTRTVVCLAFCAFSSIAHSANVKRATAEEESNETSSPIRLDNDNFVVREGKRLVIPCVYASDDMTDMRDLKWLSPNGMAIDGESDSSVFTIGLHEHGTKYIKKSLHFSSINRRDEGTYICQAKNDDGKSYKRNVKVSVLDPIEWASTETQVGGLVGEPLTIDCSAKGKPEPQIQITNAEGTPLNDQLFTIAGNEVSVPSLTKEYNGLIVNCVALQVIPELDTTSTEQRTVHIDVWFAPEFEKLKVDRYAIIGRNASLPCNVSSSNPPVRHFNFYRNNVLMNEESKYMLLMDVLENNAVMQIFQVTEDDLGEYRCEVFNSKAKAVQTMMLKEANPPDEVKATLLEVKKHGFIWKIETDDEDELPPRKIEIQYAKKRSLEGDNGVELTSEEMEQKWKSHSTKSLRTLREDEEYEVGGLRAHTEYMFRFRAESEAGFGPFVTIGASTDEEANNNLTEPDSAPAISCFSCILAVCLNYVLFY